ncbi:MAG TPA: putative capsular polysaccharide synthesis family protein [Spirillospora sp.]|nr:putative capsular polysaccharide synthesis family protein [Spirillospora sp.]
MQLSRLPYRIRRGLQVYTSLYLRRQTPILIYTTGRVGSMALHHALEQHGAFAFQIHTLDPVRLIENQQPGTAVWAYRHIVRPGRRAYIITLVRDPLSVMVSDFFPKLRWITGQNDAYRHYSVDDLCDIFVTRYFEQGRHLEKLNWYENEMQASLGIDVYQHDSPRETGYAQFAHPPYEVMVLKTELADELKSQVIAEFLKLDTFCVTRRNVGETKSYGDIYKAFKQQLVVPETHLETIYSSRYAQHFYTPEEIDAMMRRWRTPRPV